MTLRATQTDACEAAPLDVDAVEVGCLDQQIGCTIVYQEETQSTNSSALFLANQGYPTGTVVITDLQLAGRGRFGRTWHMGVRASIACSVILRPHLAPTRLNRLGMAAAIGLVDACRKGFVPADIKWPNDVVVGDRKLGGVLVEAALQGQAVKHVVVGIGLNVNEDFSKEPELRKMATSIQLVRGFRIDRAALLVNILRELDRWMLSAYNDEHLLNAWADRSATLGQAVTVHDPQTDRQMVAGSVIGLESDGGITVRDGRGETRRFAYAEVSVRHEPLVSA